MKLLNNPYAEAVNKTLVMYQEKDLSPYMGFEDGLLYKGWEEGSKAQMKSDAQENKGALRDYSIGKISLRKLAERISVNYQSLIDAFGESDRELLDE